MTRRTKTQSENESAFKDKINKLFDVAHADALYLIKNAEDRAFLEDQRGPRIGYMGGVDNTLAKKEDRKRRRLHREETLRRLEHERQQEEYHCKTTAAAEVLDSDSTSSSDKDDPLGPCCSTSTLRPSAKKHPSNLITPELSSALDRANVNNRNATFFLAAAASSLGCAATNFAINPESIRKARLEFRSTSASVLKTDFLTSVRVDGNESIPLTVHWDGKMLPDITGNETVDRLPVLVSGCGTEQLLGVPKLLKGTGETVSNAVYSMLEEWSIKNQVKALSFDTTAVNTGRLSGACVLLEAKLGRNLLYLSCRHHVHEVVLSDVFKCSFGPSSGPEISLFKRFRDYWPRIDKTKFQTAVQDPMCADILSQYAAIKSNVLSFVKETLVSSKQPRDDYRELLELTVLFLGDEPPRGTRLMAPGAMHRARWMAKLIYAIKVWIFKDQFHLTAKEEKAARDVSLFGCLLYVKAWFSCTLPSSAPANDLNFLKMSHEYQATNERISKAATHALLRHMWYLSEELVALAFFDQNTDTDTKRKMVAALSRDGMDEPPKRIQLAIDNVAAKEISDFVTRNTKTFFNILGISSDFVKKFDPELWTNLEDYKLALKIVDSLAVVNDRAERGVKLMQDYNRGITRNEDQKEFLLQVVSEHRRKFPKANKSLLVKHELRTSPNHA